MIFLRTVLGICLTASCLYYLLCLDSARRWFHTARRADAKRGPDDTVLPPIAILKPVRGSDPEQYANFASFCRQDYPCYQIVFGALDPQDPGLETARRIAADFPDCDIKIVAGGKIFGLNRKICNLESIRRVVQYDLFVLCDSDMRVEPDYLWRITAPFADPNVGLVTCPYRGHEARGVAAILEALGIGADFIPSVLLTQRIEGMSFAFGSTIVLHRETLDAMGGFPAFADSLADDYLLGNRVHRMGQQVVLSDCMIDDVLGSETWREMWTRRLRWAKTVRTMRPIGWMGAFITHGTALALLSLPAFGGSRAGWIGLGVVWAVRVVTATWIARRYTHDENLPRRLVWLPLSDLVSFALWIGGFWGRHVMWRGERFRLGSGGRLEHS